MKIASPFNEVCIERSENRAFDRALIGGGNYFHLEVRTGWGGEVRTFTNFEPYEKNFGQKFYLRTFALFKSAKVRK